MLFLLQARDKYARKESQRLSKLGRKKYYVLPGGDVSIIRGHRNEYHKYFSCHSRGNQDIPICLTSYVMERLLPIDKWSSSVIDMILDVGDQLYKDSFIMYNPTDKKLGLHCVIRDVVIKNVQVTIAIGKPVLINKFSEAYLAKALEILFRQKSFCMINVGDKYLALFSKGEFYYIFDPHGMDINGSVTEDGEAAVLKFWSLTKLAENIVGNYESERGESNVFHIIVVVIKSIVKVTKRDREELKAH